MTEIVPVSPDSPFPAMQFTRSASGHVHSCWWSYDWKRYNPDGLYVCNSHFHQLRAQSISAFAYALELHERNVMVSVRENPITGDTEWRCSTQFPVKLPVRKPNPQLSVSSLTAIDV